MEGSGPLEEGADGSQQLRHGWGDAAGDLEDALEAVLLEFDALDCECGTPPQARPALEELQRKLAAVS
eukprot:9627270-Lingulodinium_polyedra.AAC.1